MRILWDTPTIEYEGAQIFLFSDISRRTLMQRGMVHPLLEALRTQTDFPDWRIINTTFPMQQFEPWSRVPMKIRERT